MQLFHLNGLLSMGLSQGRSLHGASLRRVVAYGSLPDALLQAALDLCNMLCV